MFELDETIVLTFGVFMAGVEEETTDDDPIELELSDLAPDDTFSILRETTDDDLNKLEDSKLNAVELTLTGTVTFTNSLAT